MLRPRLTRAMTAVVLVSTLTLTAPVYAGNYFLLTHNDLMGRRANDGFLGNADDTLFAPEVFNFDGNASQFAWEPSIGDYGTYSGQFSVTSSTPPFPPVGQTVFGDNRYATFARAGSRSNDSLGTQDFFLQNLLPAEPSLLAIAPDQSFSTSLIVFDNALQARVQVTGVGRYLLREQDASTLYSGDTLTHFDFVQPLLPDNWTLVAQESQEWTVLDGDLAGKVGTSTLTFFSTEFNQGVPEDGPNPIPTSLGAPWVTTGFAGTFDVPGLLGGDTSTVVGDSTHGNGTATLTDAPAALDNLAIGLEEGEGTVTVTGAAAVLTVGPNGVIDIGGQAIRGLNGGTGVLNVQNGATVNGLGVSIGDFSGTAASEINITGPGSNLALTCDGNPICTSGQFPATGILVASGTVAVKDQGRISMDAGANPVAANLTMFGGELLVDGAGSEISIRADDSTTTALSGLDVTAFFGPVAVKISNGGKITISGPTAIASLGGSAQGSIAVEGEGSLLEAGTRLQLGVQAAPEATPDPLSELRLDDGGIAIADRIVIQQTGLLTGNGGTLVGPVQNAGVIAPGNSPGTLTIDGNLEFLSTGRLRIELGGTTAGVDYDVLNVTGRVRMAGTLEIVLLDGFTPDDDDTFEFLNASSFFFSLFDEVIAPTFGSGRTLQPFFRAGGISLEVVPAPVPLPGALLLFGSGAFALIARRRQSSRTG